MATGGATLGGSWPPPAAHQAAPRPFSASARTPSTENAVAAAAVAAAEAAAQGLPDPPRVPFPINRAASDENLLRAGMRAGAQERAVSPLLLHEERQAGQHDGGVSVALQNAMWAALEHDGTSDAGNGQDY